MFDDLRSNATLTAMLVYLASEDPQLITRERVDLVKGAAEAQERLARMSAAAARNPSGRAYRFPTTWPACEKAARITEPRLK